MAKQKLDTRAEQLARWMHDTLANSSLVPATKRSTFRALSLDSKARYYYVARQLIENPPACLTQQTEAKIDLH